MDARQRPAQRPDGLRARLHQRVPARGGRVVPTRTLSVRHARRLALHAQGLAGPAISRRRGPEAVAALTRRIGCLQLDPVSAVARSPLLVAFARLGPVRDDVLDLAAYRDRALFDAWAHEASLVASADLPLHRWAVRRTQEATGPRAQRARAFLTENAAFADDVVAELRERGPTRARDLQDRSATPWQHGWWTDEVSAKQTVGRMLHLLWTHGRIGVGARDPGGGRLWDVIERCLPEGASLDGPDGAAAERAAVLRAVRMLGVARPAHVRVHFLRRAYADLSSTLDALCRDGALERVAVRGLGDGWYAAPEDAERAFELAPGTRTTVLSPFDNLLCDRARTAELFGFDHRLEIYVPRAKRIWGYYVLPILHRERLVARADLAVRDGVLDVLAMHREPGVRRSAAAERAVGGALERLAAWRGAAGISETG